MRRFAFLAALAVMLFGFASTAFVRADTPADAAKAPANVTNKYCPVMGTDSVVDPKIRMEYEHQYVYFCCEGCMAMFKKEPAKYVATMTKEDREAIKANDKCPVSGEAIANFDIKSEANGKLVYFCCAGCKSTFDKKNAPAN